MAEFFMMPAASPTMEVGRLASWIIDEGATIEFGTVIAEVETDKATAEIESFDDGVLLKILQPAGSDVKVNSPIAIIGFEGDDISELVAQFEAGDMNSADSTLEEDQTTTDESQESVVKAGPAARVQADAVGVSLSNVKGTGPRGRVLSSDLPINTSMPTGEAQVTPYGWQGHTLHDSIMEMPVTFTPSKSYPNRRGSSSNLRSNETIAVPNSMMRKTIASRLKASYLDAPTFFLNAKIDCNNLVAFRKHLKGTGVFVSYNDLVIKAVAKALVDVPAVNASWTEDTIIRHGRVDVGMAVALPEGLITPVIRNADQRPLSELGAETKELVGKAKDMKLTPEEYSDSTFTISNLGMMKIEHFTAIINPPNAAILAVGAMQQEPVVTDGKLSVGWRMKVTMTCDHRVIDGALGAEFLLAFRKYIEFPGMLV
jgi:pyruvate dehydrogenase E2 component (dihydrolipoamide acetyltransferase)